jgi:hypothetical protein
MNDLSSLIEKLEKEVTPEGKEILIKLVDRIIFELNAISMTLTLENE